MKKIFFVLIALSLTVSTGLSVSAADTATKQANLTIQAGTLDLVVDNDIDFGFVTLDGSTQTKANTGAPINVSVSDQLGDSSGWGVRLNIAPLQNGLDPLAGQLFDFTAAGSTVSGTGVTAGINSVGVAPGTDISVLQGDSASLTGSILLNPGFLTLTIGSSAVAGTYTGVATFSVVTIP